MNRTALTTSNGAEDDVSLANSTLHFLKNALNSKITTPNHHLAGIDYTFSKTPQKYKKALNYRKEATPKELQEPKTVSFATMSNKHNIPVKNTKNMFLNTISNTISPNHNNPIHVKL